MSIDFNATAWGLPAGGFPGIPAPTPIPKVIPEAVEAAAEALNAYLSSPYDETDIHELHPEILVVLEAALPHLLSHEREETRLAHVDAVVNAEANGLHNRCDSATNTKRRKAPTREGWGL